MKFLIFCITFALGQINTNAGDFLGFLLGRRSIPKLFGMFILIMFLLACGAICRCCCGCCDCCFSSQEEKNMKQQSLESSFSWNKAPKIQDFAYSKVCINNTTEQLPQLMVLFKTHTLKLSFQQCLFWFTMEIKDKSITRNFDALNLKLVGKDIHGNWQLNGSIYINNDQIECSLNKTYDDKKAENGDLYYTGIYNEKDLKFKGNWQFEKSGLRGQWEGQFK